MPKQVRLRRGTTVQHGTFVGAEAELTVDTTKKCLVLHDGVSPGGKPVTGWLVLVPGNSLLQQDIQSCVRISGGNEDVFGLMVDAPASFGSIVVSGDAEFKSVTVTQQDLTYSATVNLDFGTFGTKRLALSGNVTFTTSNVGFGRELLVRVSCDGSLRTLAFPGGWKFVGGAAPANIAASKVGLLRLWSFGVNDSSVVAQWLVEP